MSQHRGCQDAILIDEFTVDVKLHMKGLLVGWITSPTRALRKTMRHLISLWESCFKVGMDTKPVTFDIKVISTNVQVLFWDTTMKNSRKGLLHCG